MSGEVVRLSGFSERFGIVDKGAFFRRLSPRSIVGERLRWSEKIATHCVDC